MLRYFQSLGAGRPINLGGRPFIFEPVEPMGGSWIGVLALDDESGANILASAGLEITQERYDSLKKKRMGQSTAQDSGPSRTPPKLPPQPIVVAAARAEDRIVSSSEASPVPVPQKTVTLKTTSVKPPQEPILEADAPKRRKAA